MSIRRMYALILVVAAAGCGGEPEELGIDVTALGGGSSFFTPPPCAPGSWSCGGREGPLTNSVLAEACTDHRWVGYRLDGANTCMGVNGATLGGTWHVRKPFLPGPYVTPPVELQRVCIYDWVPSTRGPGPPVVSVLPNTWRMRLERDCRVVAPMYQTTPPTAAELLESYDEQLGSPQFAFGASAPAVRTRVAIIDSSAEETALGRPSHGASDHGFVVGSVAHRNSCMRSPAGEIGCTAFVSNHLGLPLGGNSAHGYPSDVGSAIYRAVVAWKAPPQAQPNLIVNLSLGWDASYGAAPGPKMRMGSLAAYLAAQFATCEGAMLVAAAGNESQPASPSGPLYPAGWELDDASCPVSSIYGSVLFSVGVVDGQDRTLGIAREGATPRMVAPGAFAVSQARNPVTGAPMGETEMLTGTSISAASVSGVAAMVWAMQPSLTATDVMNEVYRQAVTLHPIADFQHAPLNWSVRRLSACQAVMDVCAPGSCPIGCVPRPARSDARPDFSLVVDSEYPGLVAAPTVAIITRLGAIPTGADVLEQPWAGPQPGVDPCPVCGYMGQNLMGRLEIPPGAVLTSLVVRPEPAAVAEGFSIQLEHQDAPFNIDMAYAFDIAAIDKATIEVTTLTNGKEVVRTSELFIEP